MWARVRDACARVMGESDPLYGDKGIGVIHWWRAVVRVRYGERFRFRVCACVSRSRRRRRQSASSTVRDGGRATGARVVFCQWCACVRARALERFWTTVWRGELIDSRRDGCRGERCVADGDDDGKGEIECTR